MPIDGKITSASIYFSGRSSPYNTDGYVALYATSGGLPTGSPLAISQTINGVPAQSSSVFNLVDCPLLTKNTVYALVFVFTQAGGAIPTYNSSSSYSGGNRVTSSNGTSWTAQTGQDISITNVNYTIGENGKIYKTNASFAGLVNSFIGFSKNSGTKDSNIIIKTDNLITGLSSLTPSGTVYLSNTPGALSMSAGTVSRKIGTALTSTTLLVKHDNI